MMSARRLRFRLVVFFARDVALGSRKASRDLPYLMHPTRLDVYHIAAGYGLHSGPYGVKQ